MGASRRRRRPRWRRGASCRSSPSRGSARAISSSTAHGRPKALAHPAVLRRHVQAQEARLPQRLDGLRRKATVLVHGAAIGAMASSATCRGPIDDRVLFLVQPVHVFCFFPFLDHDFVNEVESHAVLERANERETCAASPPIPRPRARARPMLLTNTFTATFVSPGCPSSPTTGRNVSGLSTSPWTSASTRSTASRLLLARRAVRRRRRRRWRRAHTRARLPARTPHRTAAEHPRRSGADARGRSRRPDRRSERADSRCGSLPCARGCTNSVHPC